MPDPYSAESLAAARDYFRQPEPRFWMWGDDAISWTDGATIAFHRELAQIMRRLAFDGLPRFTPLVILLAACRDSYRRERVAHALSREKALLTGNVWHGHTSDDWLAALDRVAMLPQELRSSIEAKAVLVETVFAGNRFFFGEPAWSAIELLNSRNAVELLGADNVSARATDDTQMWTKEELLGASADLRPHVTTALVAMHRGLMSIDADALRLRLRTGLDQLVEPAEIELPADESLRAFISRLRHDPELAGFGRLAHDLMAAVQVPRGVSEPEELPLGGVSDIANRGPLDRLLISELAHDDLTLAVRVAVSEALYLRREAPPRTPVRQRFLLIDCGIRLWGVPRVFAAAVGLALAATADRNTEVAAWRATAHDIEPVELGTREGLIGLLEQLEAAPQPGAALPRFCETVDRSSTAADTILITQEDVLTDADFRRAVADLGDRQFYMAMVNRSGRFRLLLHCGRGTKTIREAQFDLDRLLSPAARPTAPLIQQDAGSDLPTILSVEPFPLLLPHPVTNGRIVYHTTHGAVTLTHDGRLMHWRRAGLAAAQITGPIPPGRLHHLSIDDDGVVRVVVGSPGDVYAILIKVCLTSRSVEIAVVDARFDAPLRVALFQGCLFFMSNHFAWVVSDEGRASPPVKTTGHYFNGRFFKSRKDWYALSRDGHGPRFTRLPIHRSIDSSSIAMMFDRTGVEGPWVITTAGRIVSTVDGRELLAGWRGKFVVPLAMSPCGHQMVLFPRQLEGAPRLRHARKRYFADKFHVIVLPPKAPVVTVRPCPWNVKYAFALEPELRRLVRPVALPHRFQKIGVDRDGRLTLLSRRGRAWMLARRTNRPGVHIMSAPTASVRHLQAFETAAIPPGIKFKLRVARWADGSRAWLDSRGLLHLKSSDRALPEVTIVLVPRGEVAASDSDGRLWGPTFYTGIERQAARPGEDLPALIDAFVARLA